MGQKKVKRKLNIKGVILILLILYFIVMLLYTFFTRPIKNIYIENTTLLTDHEIIEAAGIKDYPALFKLSEKKLEERILQLELVDDVEVKKNLLGKLTISVEEAVPLYYNRITNQVVLSSGLGVDSSRKYLGIPTLINNVPKEMLNKFNEAFKNIDKDIISMINEIEYSPDISDDITIDDSRFILKMNDTNLVYVNVINMERLNDYKDFLAMIGDNRGILYLDSYNSSNNLLGLFEYFSEEEEDTEEKKEGESEDALEEDGVESNNNEED